MNKHGEMRHAYKMKLGKPGKKRMVGRPRHIWEDNIKTDPHNCMY